MTVFCPVGAAARRAPDAPAILFGDERWSYARLEARIQHATRALTARGIVGGDRVALLSQNHPDTVALLFAALRTGVSLVPLNTRLVAPELAARVAQVKPALVLATDDLRPLLPDALPISDLWKHGSVRRAGSVSTRREWPEDVLALVLFTSGTTGTPKAACLSAGNLDAAARASAERLGASASDRWLCTLPLFHIGGLVMAYRAVWAGACLVLEPRFDAVRAWQLIGQERVTHASFVSTTLSRLLEAANSARGGSSVQAVLVGGGPVPRALWSRAREAGLPVVQTYGLTETTAQICTEPPGDADGLTAGPPLRGCEVRVQDEAGRVLGLGEVGEIVVRGPTVIAGYLDDSGAVRDARQEGWLATGDLGALEGRGRLRVEARRTDLILSGGENLYPAEVEAVLLDHPAIAEVAVVGEADAEWGQVPVAFVAFRGAVADGEGLEQWCRGKLGGFKVPRRFVNVTELPRNAAGKINRDALRSLLTEGQRGQT